MKSPSGASSLRLNQILIKTWVLSPIRNIIQIFKYLTIGQSFPLFHFSTCNRNAFLSRKLLYNDIIYIIIYIIYKLPNINFFPIPKTLMLQVEKWKSVFSCTLSATMRHLLPNDERFASQGPETSFHSHDTRPTH